jgi:hypothetical protein
MTFDPFLLRYRDHLAQYQTFIDSPPYRYGRIGFSLLTKVLSGDRATLYPATMVLSILGAIGLSAFMLASAARGSGGSALAGALIILVPGFWTSLYAGLPEPVAAAALLSGYLCLRSRAWVAAGVLFAISVLVRETGCLLVLCLAVPLVTSGASPSASWCCRLDRWSCGGCTLGGCSFPSSGRAHSRACRTILAGRSPAWSSCGRPSPEASTGRMCGSCGAQPSGTRW